MLPDVANTPLKINGIMHCKKWLILLCIFLMLCHFWWSFVSVNGAYIWKAYLNMISHFLVPLAGHFSWKYVVRYLILFYKKSQHTVFMRSEVSSNTHGSRERRSSESWKFLQWHFTTISMDRFNALIFEWCQTDISPHYQLCQVSSGESVIFYVNSQFHNFFDTRKSLKFTG